MKSIASVLLSAAVLFSVTVMPAAALVSLVNDDRIDTCRVSDDSSYTIIRDAHVSEQWYYVPNEPRLTFLQLGNEKVPEFELLAFQVRDGSGGPDYIAGGLLQFAVSLSASDNVLAALRACIEAQSPGPAQLAPLPLSEAKVHVYTPDGSKLLVGGAKGAGIAPTFASQKMVFLLELSTLGADIYRSLTAEGSTGIPVAVEFSYPGLTPPDGFTVDVDYVRVHQHYSKSSVFAAKVGKFGLFGRSVSLSARKEAAEIWEQLTSDKSVEVVASLSPNFTQADLEKYLQPLLQRINAELLEASKPPEKINPAAAPSPASGGGWLSGGWSVAIKKQSEIKKLKERVSFKFRHRVENKSVASGFISLRGYPRPIRERAMRVLGPSLFDSVDIVLPHVGDAASEHQVDSIDLDIALVAAGGLREQLAVSWRKQDGFWTNARGAKINRVGFPLLSLSPEARSTATLQSMWRVTSRGGRDELKVSGETPVISRIGSVTSTVASPTAGLEFVEIDARGLDWGESSRLLQVDVQLSAADRTVRHTFRRRRNNDRSLPPEPLYWPVRASDATSNSIQARVSFTLKGGQRVESAKVTAALRDGLVVTLEDCDYLRVPECQ